MTTVTCWSHRCRTNTLFAAILVLGAYALVFDKHDDVTGGNHLFTFYRAMLRERLVAATSGLSSQEVNVGLRPYL